MKKIQIIFLAIIGMLVLSGCSNSETEKLKGNCDPFKCMEKISIDNTYEDINTILGFEGSEVNESASMTTYKWVFNEDLSIKAYYTPSTGKAASIELSFPIKSVKKRADFSKWDEIKSKLKSEEKLTYAEFVKLVGGVDGILEKISSSSLTYKWYDNKNGYLFAYFNPKTMECTLASGRF